MNKKFLIIILSVAIVFILASILMRIKYYECNPIKEVIGYIQISILNKNYSVVQNTPTKVVFTKSDYYLQDYMKDMGFVEIAEEQMGYSRVFTNGEVKERVICWSEIDGYPFSIWEWH